MPGYRRPKIAAERVGAAIKSGAASSASLGGEIIATPIRDRGVGRRPPKLPEPVAGGGVYIPAFSVAGPVEQRDYLMPLHNVTGGILTITAVTVGFGSAPFGGETRVRVVNDTVGETITTVVAASGQFFAQVTGLSYSWGAGAAIYVTIPTITGAEPGSDMAVQVVTA